MQDVVHDMASQAFAQLDAGKKVFQSIDDRKLRKKVILPLLASVPVELYLNRLQKEGHFDPFLMDRLDGQQTPLSMQLRLLYAKTFSSL